MTMQIYENILIPPSMKKAVGMFVGTFERQWNVGIGNSLFSALS